MFPVVSKVFPGYANKVARPEPSAVNPSPFAGFPGPLGLSTTSGLPFFHLDYMKL